MITLPQKWSEWTIEELIGQGAYGKVYRIRKENMGNVSYAALKVIEIPESAAEVKTLLNSGMDHLSVKSYFEQTARSITNEIAMLESLKSASNIVIIEDYNLEEKKDSIGWKILIRMELLEPLSDYQLKKGSLSTDEAVRLGIDIASALECCEGMNIIHRDVKPENVFVNRFGTYKLGDFGIAKRLENTTSAYSQKGTGLYMAPEVNRGEKYNQTVDIYSLGVMLYQFLNNQRLPFLPSDKKLLTPADFQMAVERRLSGEALPMPAGADEILGRIILKACAPEPAKRYQSASELKTALQNWKEGHTKPVSDTPAKITKEPVIEAPIKSEKPSQPKQPAPGPVQAEVNHWKPVVEKNKEAVKLDRPKLPEPKNEANQKNQMSSAAAQKEKTAENSGKGYKLGLIICGVIFACIIIFAIVKSGNRKVTQTADNSSVQEQSESENAVQVTETRNKSAQEVDISMPDESEEDLMDITDMENRMKEYISGYWYAVTDNNGIFEDYDEGHKVFCYYWISEDMESIKSFRTIALWSKDRIENEVANDKIISYTFDTDETNKEWIMDITYDNDGTESDVRFTRRLDSSSASIYITYEGKKTSLDNTEFTRYKYHESSFFDCQELEEDENWSTLFKKLPAYCYYQGKEFSALTEDDVRNLLESQRINYYTRQNVKVGSGLDPFGSNWNFEDSGYSFFDAEYISESNISFDATDSSLDSFLINVADPSSNEILNYCNRLLPDGIPFKFGDSQDRILQSLGATKEMIDALPEVWEYSDYNNHQFLYCLGDKKELFINIDNFCFKLYFTDSILSFLEINYYL